MHRNHSIAQHQRRHRATWIFVVTKMLHSVAQRGATRPTWPRPTHVTPCPSPVSPRGRIGPCFVGDRILFNPVGVSIAESSTPQGAVKRRTRTVLDCRHGVVKKRTLETCGGATPATLSGQCDKHARIRRATRRATRRSVPVCAASEVPRRSWSAESIPEVIRARRQNGLLTSDATHPRSLVESPVRSPFRSLARVPCSIPCAIPCSILLLHRLLFECGQVWHLQLLLNPLQFAPILLDQSPPATSRCNP